MRIVLRADAGIDRGTGHVMRCLTVGEALKQAGHSVVLMGQIEGVEWLTRHVEQTGIEHHACERDDLRLSALEAMGADRVVVDSYWIDPGDIATADAAIPTMVIVDNDIRGIRASYYLDQNLGAESGYWEGVEGTVLAGSRYALVRRAILEQRVSSGWDIPGRESHVVAFMGGTDPGRYMTEVVRVLAADFPKLRLTAVTTLDQLTQLRTVAGSMPNARFLGPTPDLPALLGSADAIVSAAGTSAWDVFSMGKPALLIGVASNQSSGLARAIEMGLAIGLDATRHGTSGVGALLAQLLDDAVAREERVRRANGIFDGAGARRVAEVLSKPS